MGVNSLHACIDAKISWQTLSDKAENRRHGRRGNGRNSTVYIEDIGSGMKTRMQSWVGSVPFYKSAHVNEPPTLLGRALRATNAELASLGITQARVYGEKGRIWAL